MIEYDIENEYELEIIIYRCLQGEVFNLSYPLTGKQDLNNLLFILNDSQKKKLN